MVLDGFPTDFGGKTTFEILNVTSFDISDSKIYLLKFKTFEIPGFDTGYSLVDGRTIKA